MESRLAVKINIFNNYWSSSMSNKMSSYIISMILAQCSYSRYMWSLLVQGGFRHLAPGAKILGRARGRNIAIKNFV